MALLERLVPALPLACWLAGGLFGSKAVGGNYLDVSIYHLVIPQRTSAVEMSVSREL